MYEVRGTSFGRVKVKYDNEYVLSIQFSNDVGGEGNLLTDTVFSELEEYFDGKRKHFSFPYKLEGTSFQKRVWDALLNVEYGQTSSYGELAKRIGQPKASRAVGMALGKNPIMIVVPCHRVIGKDGSITGYAGGIENKKKLLELEKKHYIRL